MDQDRIAQLVLKLIKLTNTDKIEWKSLLPTDMKWRKDPGYLIDKVYRTQVNGKSFQLYRYKEKWYREEDDYEWIVSTRLELIDENEYTDYEFEYSNSMNDLYEIVREKTSKAEEIINQILNI